MSVGVVAAGSGEKEVVLPRVHLTNEPAGKSSYRGNGAET